MFDRFWRNLLSDTSVIHVVMGEFNLLSFILMDTLLKGLSELLCLIIFSPFTDFDENRNTTLPLGLCLTVYWYANFSASSTLRLWVASAASNCLGQRTSMVAYESFLCSFHIFVNVSWPPGKPSQLSVDYHSLTKSSQISFDIVFAWSSPIM